MNAPIHIAPFFHYNTWYDLGFAERYDEAGILDRVHAFGEELVRKRGVVMNSFLLDDGWDDGNSLWGFDVGLPDGLSRVKDEDAQYGFGIEVWLSPWGGYDKQKLHRICIRSKRGTGVGCGHQYDGTALPTETVASPSPFWLRYADSVWRSGEDHSFAGTGCKRQQWVTYRDGQTYRAIVQLGHSIHSISLMLHGIIYTQKAEGLNTDPGHDFADEVHSLFRSRTQLEEIYITPPLLSSGNWDTLTAAARWSRRNAMALKDTHWAGGDPLLLPYGWAAWSSNRAIVTIRNLSDHAQTFVLDLTSVLELPSDAAQQFHARRI